MEIRLFSAWNAEPMPDDRFQELLRRFPEAEQARVLRFISWRDRQATLLGRVLLADALGISGMELCARLRFNAWGKPFLEQGPAFSIAHSGDHVLCALSDRGALGLDIEAHKEVPFQDFQRFMSEAQWADIHASASPLKRFFEYWAMKEAVIKAVGKGLSIPLEEVHFQENVCEVEGFRLFLSPLADFEGASAFVASDFLPEF